MDGTLWIGALVMLRDQGGDAFASRVESTSDGSLTVAKPIGVPAADPYPIGTPFDVMWTDPTGLNVLPTRLTATHAEAPVLLWELTAVGEPHALQRREFARVPVFGRLVLTARDADPPAVARHGYLVDMSEVAIATSVWADADDPLLAVGTEVACLFTAHGEEFRRDGRILSARPSDQDCELWVVIRLEQTEGEAKALRRQVFAAQVDIRRMLLARSDARSRARG